MTIRPTQRYMGDARLLSLVLAGTLLGSPAAAQRADGRFTFAVVGHIRGNSDQELHPGIDELVAELRHLKPDLLFLTGDLIWGSVPKALTDSSAVAAQWELLDNKLEVLGIPIYRVPGNHDIHDPVTRDVFFARYGKLPRTVVYRGSRFFLLNSTFTPEGDAPVPLSMKLSKTVRLDSIQVGFVRRELERQTAAHDFLFMHHVLWFEERAPWWDEMHPALARQRVNAVFAGDLGPAMYTHMTRDSVEYFRSVLNATVNKPLKADAVEALLRTLQFESFLMVAVDGPEVSYSVHTVGALSSEAFSPNRWREVFGPDPDPGKYYDPATFRPPTREPAAGTRPEPGLLARAWKLVGSPRRAVALGLFTVLVFAGGVVIGQRRRGGGVTAA